MLAQRDAGDSVDFSCAISGDESWGQHMPVMDPVVRLVKMSKFWSLAGSDTRRHFHG